MSDHQLCRLSVSDGELELAGPPAALRALGRQLRQYGAQPLDVAISGGSVVQEVTCGPLLVSLPDAITLHVSGGHEYLDILWEALDGVAHLSETADDRA
jgi:hypothetical protein